MVVSTVRRFLGAGFEFTSNASADMSLGPPVVPLEPFFWGEGSPK